MWFGPWYRMVGWLPYGACLPAGVFMVWACTRAPMRLNPTPRWPVCLSPVAGVVPAVHFATLTKRRSHTVCASALDVCTCSNMTQGAAVHDVRGPAALFPRTINELHFAVLFLFCKKVNAVTEVRYVCVCVHMCGSGHPGREGFELALLLLVG